MVKQIAKAQKICLELMKEVRDICEQNQLTYWIDGGTLLGAKRHNGFIPWDDDVDICLPIPDYFKLLDYLQEKIAHSDNRMLYFHGSDFPMWFDHYASTEYLCDGIFPVRVDLIPVIYWSSDKSKFSEQESLRQIANLYIRGYLKNSSKVLPVHKKYLPKNFKNQVDERRKFLSDFLTLNSEIYNEEKNDSNAEVNYIFSDSYVKSERRGYAQSTIFPLKKRTDFENEAFSQPNNRDVYLETLYGVHHMSLPPDDQKISHQLFLKKNRRISAIELQKMIIDIYTVRFHCYDLSKNQKKHKRYLLRLKHFSKLSLRWFFQGKWLMIYSLACYYWAYSKNKN
jgi:lipopolysaccharide cholinephosphotransferase